MQSDAISRNAAMNFLLGLTPLADKHECARALAKIPALGVAPVVHEKGVRSSVITVKDSDEWQDRIILADESTQVCAVYYADDSELMPVVHARWIHDINNLYGCSKCMTRETMSHKKLKQFCPNCGARMDGETE